MGFTTAFQYFLLLLALTLTASAHPPKRNCAIVKFNIHASAETVTFPNPPGPDDEAANVQFMANALYPGPVTNGTQTTTGDFVIHGLYCKPTANVKKTANTLQLLVHGITYNSTMWSGYGFGDQYNWHHFANAKGYHTLAIDRLGQGLNSRAFDPLLVVQPAMQLEIIHQLITAVRSGARNNALGRKFGKIFWVGHSYGSMLGVQHARLHPADTDAMVLTGYSSTLSGAMASLQLGSASQRFPVRFGPISAGYMVTVQQSQRETEFYAPPGAYDPAIAAIDYAYQDTVTTGEFGGLAIFSLPAPGYRKPVLLVTGVNDLDFCVPTQAGCEEALRKTGALVPNARTFEYVAVPNTGHDLTLHYSVGRTLTRVHQFLERW